MRRLLVSKIIDIIGIKYHFLTVIRRVRRIPNRTEWLCKCDCGNEKIIDGVHLKSGHSKSCGCYQKKIASTANSRHGFTRYNKIPTEYRIWSNMKKRCTSNKHKYFYNYGGRGIKICERWSKFENFLNDMGERPSKDHSIDRIDNDGNYEPNNCRWSTRKEQARNRRNNINISYKGRTKILLDWCTELNMNYRLVKDRIKNGWSIKDAFEAPISALGIRYKYTTSKLTLYQRRKKEILQILLYRGSEFCALEPKDTNLISNASVMRRILNKLTKEQLVVRKSIGNKDAKNGSGNKKWSYWYKLTEKGKHFFQGEVEND